MNLPSITVVELHRKSSDDSGVESALRARRVMNGYVKCTGCLSLSNSLLIIISFFLQYIIIFYLSYLVGVILTNYSAVFNSMTVKHFVSYP